MSDDPNSSQSNEASEVVDGSASAATTQYGDHFLLRRKFLKIFGQSFHVYDANDQVCFFAKLKAFKLKEDIRIYADTDQQNELLRIQARSVIDFGATYDVIDSAQDLKLGTLRRKGLKSILRDSWLILDVNDEEIGTLRNEGKTILFSTHIMSEAERLCDRIAVIHRGRLLANDTLEVLRGQTGEHYLEQIFIHLVQAHDRAHDKASAEPTVEPR